MIKNAKVLERFEREQLREERLTYADALKITEALWEEGRALGVLPPQNPLDGIESDIRIAAILNSKSSTKCLSKSSLRSARH